MYNTKDMATLGSSIVKCTLPVNSATKSVVAVHENMCVITLNVTVKKKKVKTVKLCHLQMELKHLLD